MVGILSPERFYGIDVFVDSLIILVAALISYQSRKIYLFIKEKNYEFFSWAFLSIAISFFFKVIADLTILKAIRITQPNFIAEIVHEQLETLQLINFFAALLYKIFLMLGFMTFFLIVNKNKKSDNVLLFIYLSILTVILSIYFHFIFYVTLAVIVLLLTIYFYDNYKKKKTKNRLLVFLAFLLVLISNLLGIFYEFSPEIYLIEELFLFFGFLTLLANHLRLKNGKEKNKA
ncbi:MAG: hypothetical protein Q7S56_00330 [Nanoarchaeota archaeon]|nr:hypothetical protein [Nanoarchaeota archaeon]